MGTGYPGNVVNLAGFGFGWKLRMAFWRGFVLRGERVAGMVWMKEGVLGWNFAWLEDLRKYGTEKWIEFREEKGKHCRGFYIA